MMPPSFLFKTVFYSTFFSCYNGYMALQYTLCDNDTYFRRGPILPDFSSVLLGVTPRSLVRPPLAKYEQDSGQWQIDFKMHRIINTDSPNKNK